MTNNKTRRSSNKPEESHKGRGKPQERNANHEEPHVEGLLGHDVACDVLRPLVIDCNQKYNEHKRKRERTRERGGRTESVDDSKSSKEEDEGDEKERTCDTMSNVQFFLMVRGVLKTSNVHSIYR